jgi:hypothetical protein
MTILDALYRTRFLGQDKLKRARALSGLRPSELPRYVPASDHPRESFVGPGATGRTHHPQLYEKQAEKRRGRDGDCSPPPAQIPASGATAPAPALGHDAEPHVGKRMPKARGRQPEVGQSFHTLPGQPADLAPPPERAAPVPADMAIERVDRPAVGGNGELAAMTKVTS